MKQFFLFLLIIYVSLGESVFAQGTDASITGRIFSEDNNEPLPGAAVIVTNQSTGFSTGATTDINGKFILKDMPLGGPYSITFQFLGYQPQVVKGYHLNLGDQIVIDHVKLSQGVEVLREVEVTGNGFQQRRDRLGSATAVTGKELEKLPTSSRNYTELAALSPHTKGGAIAGNKPGTSGYLLDGVTNRRTVFGEPVSGAFPISMETIREFEIVTNSYDVTNGRGAGGVIKAATKSGTNKLSGSAWGYYSGDFLSGDKDINGKEIRSDFNTQQYGVSLGGALIKDKLHFFTTIDQHKTSFPYRAFDFGFEGATLAEAEKNLGVTKANLDRMVNILERDYGIPQVQQYGEIPVDRVTNNIFAKLDWTISPIHTLTLRYNYQNFDDPAKKRGNGLLSTQYKGYERDHSFMLALRSRLTDKVTNDFRFSVMDNERLNQIIYSRVPEGFVEVSSTFEDGSTNKRSVEFGNQNWLPEVIASSSYQLINNTSFSAGKYFLTFGTDNIFTQIKDQLTHGQQGQFHYASIDDLENNNPWRFVRKIPIGDAGGKVFPQILELGFYAQAETDILPGLNLVAGLRWDATYLPEAPTYNPLLEQELGIRNDVTPFDANNIQPRLNLTWDVKGDGQNIFRAGAGWFSSQFTTQAFTMAHIDNGINFKEVDVRGADVPEADWKAYYQNFNNVPGEEYLNSLNLATPPAFMIVLDENLQTPMTFKTNVSYHRYLTNWFRVGAGFYYNNTQNNFLYLNENLKREPNFVIANEGNREVYVPATTLPGKIRADYNNARISDKFTRVLKYTNADWANTYRALVVEAALKIKDGNLNLSYTRAASKGGPRYNSGNATDNLKIGRSYWDYGSYAENWYDDEDMKHKVVVSGVSPTFYGFNVSTSLTFFQWNRFDARVNQDINGDFNAEDLAFVYDPNSSSTPEYLVNDLKTLLETTSPEYREYLESNFGNFAAGNGGLMPWRHQWNLSLSKEIKTFKGQKLVLRSDIFNVLNVLNYKWGGYEEIINTNLYTVEGFDAASNAFKYKVNANAGTKRRNVTPYNIQFGIKYVF